MLASAIVPLLILFVADRFADTPRTLRMALLAATLALCACALWNWLCHWVLRRRSYSELAVVIQRRFGKLGDRLQSAVELSEDGDCSTFQSEELRQAALRQVASDAERHDFGKAVDKLRTAKISVVSALLLVMLALLAKFAEPALLNCIGRFLNPLGEIPRFTFVVPENLPGRITVPVSELFDLLLRLSESSILRPDYAHAHLNGGSFVSAISDGSYSFRFDGIAAPSRIFLRAGDWRAAMDAVPVYRPAPEEITASIQYPEYISRTEDIVVPGSTLRILDGSSFTLSGRFSRALGTIAAETEAIELMAAMLSGMTGQSAMMAMMANAMAGKSPGFGMTADSTAENSPVNGDSHHANPDPRKPDKGFRASNFDIPARFRPFYESYIRKMEEEQ